MISFLKFLNKNNSEENQTRIEPSVKSRRQAIESEEQEPLSENPELQRSRHRLLGAGFLLLVAVIGLPRIFDSEPKKIKNDVVLKVVTSVGESTSSLIDNQSKNEVVQSSPTSVDPTSNSSSKSLSSDSKSVDSKSANSPSKESEEVVISESKPKAKDKTTDAENKLASSDKNKGKFYIQIAAYSSNERAKKTSTKLKDLNVSTYIIERKKESDSGTLYLLRSGPYTSREDAQVAVKKISELDLTPKIYEMKAAQ
jgi:DedD protein